MNEKVENIYKNNGNYKTFCNIKVANRGTFENFKGNKTSKSRSSKSHN